MLRYVMSHHVTSYHFESRGTVTRPTLHCQLTSSTRNQFKLSMTVFVGCPEGCRYHTASAVYDLVVSMPTSIKSWAEGQNFVSLLKLLWVESIQLDQKSKPLELLIWKFGVEPSNHSPSNRTLVDTKIFCVCLL